MAAADHQEFWAEQIEQLEKFTASRHPFPFSIGYCRTCLRAELRRQIPAHQPAMISSRRIITVSDGKQVFGGITGNCSSYGILIGVHGKGIGRGLDPRRCGTLAGHPVPLAL